MSKHTYFFGFLARDALSTVSWLVFYPNKEIKNNLLPCLVSFNESPAPCSLQPA